MPKKKEPEPIKDELDEVLDNAFSDSDLPPLKEQLQPYLNSLGDGSRKYEGLETGIKQFDDLIGGLNRFVLIAGMGGVGKSTLVLQMALGVCEIENIPVIYYSLEMSRRDVITMLIQNKSRKLLRNDLELRYHAKDLPKETQVEIANSINALDKIANRFYIVDASNNTPTLHTIKDNIKDIKSRHDTDKVLVILDSLQDILPAPSIKQFAKMSQIEAEIDTAQRIVEIQQETNATILAVAQKNKAGVMSGGGYGSVMGSVSFIHKPTSVLELVGGQEALNKARDNKKLKPTEIEQLENSLMQDTRNPSTPYPIYLNVIKGRNSGYGGLAFKHYGAYRYYEVGESEEFDDIYKTMREVGL